MSASIGVTFFFSESAGKKREEDLDLGTLAGRIEKMTQKSKVRLPWLKLARFGDQKTDMGCLRHDANVLTITGVEGDYDAEQMSLDEAQHRLTKAGLSAILYSSPSHTPARPRWRVLCPLATEHPPAARAGFLGRLNGVFDGQLSDESWALSQSYYYGSVKLNPDHKVIRLDGITIDQATALDAGWRGKPNTKTNGTGNGADHHQGPVSTAELLNALREGRAYHRPMIRLMGRWFHDGVPLQETRARIVEAMDSVAERDARWQTRMDDLDRCLYDIYAKEAEQRARARPAQPNPATGQMNTVAEVVDTFNAKFCVLNEHGKAIVYAEGIDPVLRRHRHDRITFEDLARLYLNQTVVVAVVKGVPIRQNVATVWLGHADRRQYIDGLVFDPTTTESKPGTLNLWRGFSVAPTKGDWGLMRRHIWEIVCDRDPVRYRYLKRWMARLVQRPAEQGEVAVVMKGGEGTGKGTLAKALLYIFGQHGLAISNSKHLTGNFNGHLRDAVLLFADEAFFAGDKAHVGVLKSLITEPYLTIEAKFQNAAQMPNFLHVIMASNENWVVPAALDARRFFVLVVSEARKGDIPYFAAIWEQMAAGGYAAMLHELLAMDISRFNVRAVPITAGLQEQKKLSLPVPEAWWLDVLHRGYVYQSRLGLEDYFAEWHDDMATDLLYASYAAYSDRARDRHPLSRETFGRFLIRMGCKPYRGRDMIVGEHIADVDNAFGGTSRKAQTITKGRAHGYSLGTLDAARGELDKITGMSAAWPQDSDDDPQS